MTTAAQPPVEATPSGWRRQLNLLGQLEVGPALSQLKRVGAQAPADLRKTASQLLAGGVGALITRPSPTVLAVLRRCRSRLPLGPLTLVTSTAGVTDILTQPSRFTVAPYAATMGRLIDGFALGQDGAAHATSRAQLDAALATIDATELGRWSATESRALLREARIERRIDLVEDYFAPLLEGFAERFLGVPAAELDDQTFYGTDDFYSRPSITAWANAAYEDCFLNLTRDRTVAQRGLFGATSLRRLIEPAVLEAQRGDRAAGRRTALTVLADGRDVSRVANDLVGIVVGALPTVCRAGLEIVDYLLDHPATADAAAQAARAGDRDQVWRHALECLRFQPQSPGVIRAEAGTGRIVLASTKAAMHDPAVVADPADYRLDRAPEVYLHFGLGPHTCPGRGPTRDILTSALITLLDAPPLSRVAGAAGRIAFNGPLPASLVVSL